MSEQRAPLTEIRYRQLFPWLLLVRCGKSSADPRKLLLAIIGVLALTGGWFAINWAFQNAYAVGEGAGPVPTPHIALPWEEGGLMERIWLIYGDDEQTLPVAVAAAGLDDPPGLLARVALQWSVVLTPYRELISPFAPLFSARYPESKLQLRIPWVGWVIDYGLFLHLSALVVWTALVWGIIGGVIARIAAMQLGRDERVSLTEAVSFCAKYIPSYASAPLIITYFLVFVALICMVGGWVTNIPYFGPLFAGTLWFLPLIAGIVMAFLIVGLAIGWPLMVPTISVEGTDAFDAISRCYAYSMQRPWNYLFYAALTVVLGSLATFVFLLFVQLILYFSYWAVSWGANDQLLARLFALTPSFLWPIFPGAGEATPADGVETIGAGLIAFWVYTMALAGGAYVYSYFWTAATAIYLLLRRDVDATDLDEIWTEEDEQDFFDFETQEQDLGVRTESEGKPAESEEATVGATTSEHESKDNSGEQSEGVADPGSTGQDGPGEEPGSEGEQREPKT